jgi:hypothetical protein
MKDITFYQGEVLMFSGPNDMPQVEIVAARLHPRVHSVHKSSEISGVEMY